jgi:hypothetical protein
MYKLNSKAKSANLQIFSALSGSALKEDYSNFLQILYVISCIFHNFLHIFDVCKKFLVLTGMINISAHIIAQLPYEATEGNGDNRNLLNNFDVPFVPEEFKSSPKRIIFDKNDFVSLLPSSDLRRPLTEAILTVLVSTRSSSNDTGVCIHYNKKISIKIYT